jgi:hypothetical protein
MVCYILRTTPLPVDSQPVSFDRVPVTKLGRLVKDQKIKSIEEIYLFSLPVKEFQIIDLLLPKLKGAVSLTAHRVIHGSFLADR